MMKLVIKDKNNVYDEGFIVYLLKFIKDYIISEISKKQNIKKINSWTEYLRNYSIYSNVNDKTCLDCEYIIANGANNLVCEKSGNVFTITIDNTKIIDEISAKLYVLCKLVDTGCLDKNKFPVFTNAFNYVQKNLESLHSSYMTGDEI